MSKVSTVIKAVRRSGELLAARQQTTVAPKLVASYLRIGNVVYPFDIPLRSGGSMHVSTRGEVKVFWQVFVHRCYRVWADCKTVVDAGANIGAFSVWAAKRLPEARILSFEPHPETFAKLEHNLAANGLLTRVQAVHGALAAQSGKRAISKGPESQRRSLIPIDLNADQESGIPVPSITLTDLLEKYNLPQIDLLKMDIEGSEWEVLHSTPASTFARIRRIQFEYHEVHARFGYSRNALFEYLKSTGYALTYCQEDQHNTGIAIVERVGQAIVPHMAA
ncbi:MAG: FkbM family methyltransferase [Terriglobales bacterium]|jgi:FkbM family methyltransferase